MPNFDDALEFNSTITDEGEDKSFLLLPEGEFRFKITNVIKSTYQGGAKMPPCPKVSVSLTISTQVGETTIQENFFLVKSMEWKFARFFYCIGLKEKGKPFAMNWDKALGCTGKCYVKQRKYDTKEGESRTVNFVERWLDPEGPDSFKSDVFSNIPDKDECPF